MNTAIAVAEMVQAAFEQFGGTGDAGAVVLRGRAHMKASVKTRSEIEDYFWSQVRKTDGCWTWKGRPNRGGYGVITWRNRRWLAHRFAWFLVKGVEPSKCLLHQCDTPACVNPDHLFEGTRQENMADKVAKGRQLRGNTCPVSKLNEDQVARARELVAAGITQKAVGRMLGVDQSTISYAVRGKTWGHI